MDAQMHADTPVHEEVSAERRAQPRAEPWRRRMLRTLLYGRNVDRTAKARARIGLAMLAFAAVYAVIAVRLVMFAVVPESHFVRRGVARDAVATARPDILDRNGLILATDVRTPSLFAEPRRMIDVDEATELLTAVLPDLDASEVRERLGSTTRLRLAQARDHRRSSGRKSTGSACRASASSPRTSASIRTAPRSRT